MIDVEKVKSNLREVLSMHSKASEILKKVNGTRDYKDISQLVGVPSTTCSSILRRAAAFGLLQKTGRTYQKTQELKYAKIDIVKKELGAPPIASPKVRLRKADIDLTQLKKQELEYLLSWHSNIEHPFSDSSQALDNVSIKRCFDHMIQTLETDTGMVQLDGLAMRFHESFKNYFNARRTIAAEMTVAFKNLVGCFEPYIKQLVAIKTCDLKLARKSLSGELIKRVVQFEGDIDQHETTYWQNRPIHEACIRVVYPFRHKEAHEARRYRTYEMERVVYYLFASIILIDENPTHI